jgi:hypothetical protein
VPAADGLRGASRMAEHAERRWRRQRPLLAGRPGFHLVGHEYGGSPRRQQAAGAGSSDRACSPQAAGTERLISVGSDTYEERMK